MSSTVDFIDYICSQIEEIGVITYKKMFGEYMIYFDSVPVLLVCNNIIYVKMLKELEALMKEAEKGVPYKGAKEHYILDIDDNELALKVLPILKEKYLKKKTLK